MQKIIEVGRIMSGREIVEPAIIHQKLHSNRMHRSQSTAINFTDQIDAYD